ncbi:hypothetical protein ABID26_004134 [Mesorhizobium shonense]|uniref:Uncharacterized protein n=1 Tax=Mesorhizobium shonense TaxID=1209948 RepID=A0ABV2HVU3_9HYPH
MPSQLVSTRLPMSPNGFGQIQTRRLWQGRLPSSKSNGVHGAWFETVFVGKDRQYNRRFLQMCSPYLVQPVACTPASG